MSRDLPPSGEEPEREPGGSLQPTGPGPLVVLGLIGLFAGWSMRGLALRAGTATPLVSWTAIGAIWFIAASTAGVAYLTWRIVHRERRRLTAHQGLVRLVLGLTISRLGSLALGGFIGVVVSYLGVSGEGAQRAISHALAAGAGAGAALAAGLMLERACRVPPRDS